MRSVQSAKEAFAEGSRASRASACPSYGEDAGPSARVEINAEAQSLTGGQKPCFGRSVM